MRAAALAVSLTLLSSACFPHNPRARTISKFSEGAALAAGVLMEAFTNSSADCSLPQPGMPDSGCKASASTWGSVGVVLILGGLLGFVATISTAPDDDDKPRQEIKVAPPLSPAPVTQPTVAPAAPAPVAPAPVAPAPAPVAPSPAPAT